MTEFDRFAHGTFGWVDLSAHDMNAAMEWYGNLFGWTARHEDTGGGPPYAQFELRGKAVAGVGQMSDEMKRAGVPPVWNSYVIVDDAAAIEAKATSLGATVMVPTMQVMEAGKLCFLQDPTGAVFALWEPQEHTGAGICNEPGSLSWNELMSSDVGKAREFYTALFGWTLVATPGGAGDYTVIRNGDRDNGGIMPLPPSAAMPSVWTVYFTVADLDAAVDKVVSTGGKVVMPKMKIEPGTMAIVSDPQGGMFTLIEMQSR